jgi:CRISPR/Cas system-associated exonuclease Cas4 (RecB family)
MIAAAVGAALWMIVRSILRRRAKAAAWLPEELMGSSLAYVERTFRSDATLPIVARVDRAYRSRRGLITLVELKTRREDRVHPSDIIELSAQRLALSSETGESVAPLAFVVVESEGRRKPQRIKLMSAREVQALVNRREGLLNGWLVPRPPLGPRMCVTCAFRTRCPTGQSVEQGNSMPGSSRRNWRRS